MNIRSLANVDVETFTDLDGVYCNLKFENDGFKGEIPIKVEDLEYISEKVSNNLGKHTREEYEYELEVKEDELREKENEIEELREQIRNLKLGYRS